MKPLDFFYRHSVFTRQEFLAEYLKGGDKSEYTANSVLAQHVASGRLLRVRRGLYTVVPPGLDPEKYSVDPYLLATKFADDAVVAYHAALQYYGKAYSIWHRFHFLIKGRVRPFRFRNSEFVAIQMPAPLRALSDAGGGIVEKPHLGGTIRVTTFERTMVDVLDRPELSGGGEEIWRSLEMVEFFDLDAVISYTLKLGSALTVARVGFYLEQHREQLMVEKRHLESLQTHRPKQPRYMGQKKKSGKFFSNWNLVVPEYILKRSWEEVL